MGSVLLIHFFSYLYILFLFCLIHVFYHSAITIYRNEWIVGRTTQEVEMRYVELRYRENTRGFVGGWAAYAIHGKQAGKSFSLPDCVQMICIVWFIPV